MRRGKLIGNKDQNRIGYKKGIIMMHIFIELQMGREGGK
jgi:hypothetical protein